jgi:nitronate monooxygenase
LRLPAIAAPMFLVSGPDLVIAAARAGIIGAFPAANARTITELADWCARIAHEATGIWAINLITHSSYDRLQAELDLVAQWKPELVITALGSPAAAVKVAKGYGGLVFADVNSIGFARKAADSGADGLILVCDGAGGHTGMLNPFVFVREVRSFWDGPLVLAGGIADGHALSAAIALGADMAYIGTRFLASVEAMSAPEYKAMVTRARPEEIVKTSAVTGVAGNFMRESLTNAGLTPEQLQAPAKIDFSGQINSGSKAWKTIWSAGQAVGLVEQEETVAQIVDALERGFGENRARLQR